MDWVREMHKRGSQRELKGKREAESITWVGATCECETGHSQLPRANINHELTASGERETSVLHPQGTEFSQRSGELRCRPWPKVARKKGHLLPPWPGLADPNQRTQRRPNNPLTYRLGTRHPCAILSHWVSDNSCSCTQEKKKKDFVLWDCALL